MALILSHSRSCSYTNEILTPLCYNYQCLLLSPAGAAHPAICTGFNHLLPIFRHLHPDSCCLIQPEWLCHLPFPSTQALCSLHKARLPDVCGALSLANSSSSPSLPRAPCRGWPGQQQRSSLTVLCVSQYCVSRAGQTRVCWGPAEIQKILEGSKGSSVPRWENATRKERGFQFSLSYSGAWLMPWDTIKSVNIWKLNNNLLIINFNWEPLQNEIAVWQSTNFQHHSQQHGWQNAITDLNFLHRSGEASDARRRWD